MSRYNELVAKIAEQQARVDENSPVFMVGEQLKDICHESENLCDIVLGDLDIPEMSLVHCEKKIKEYSDKHKKKDATCFCVTPKLAESIIRKFYGLPEKALENSADIAMDFSGAHIDLSAFM